MQFPWFYRTLRSTCSSVSKWAGGFRRASSRWLRLQQVQADFGPPARNNLLERWLQFVCQIEANIQISVLAETNKVTGRHTLSCSKIHTQFHKTNKFPSINEHPFTACCLLLTPNYVKASGALPSASSFLFFCSLPISSPHAADLGAHRLPPEFQRRIRRAHHRLSRSLRDLRQMRRRILQNRGSAPRLARPTIRTHSRDSRPPRQPWPPANL
jgi:hypothetical protein